MSLNSSISLEARERLSKALVAYAESIIDNMAFEPDLIEYNKVELNETKELFQKLNTTVAWTTKTIPSGTAVELTAWCQERGLEAIDLDDEIHELFSGKAADVNNGDLSGQVEFLVKELGFDAAKKYLERRCPSSLPCVPKNGSYLHETLDDVADQQQQ